MADVVTRVFTSQGQQVTLTVDCEGASRDDLKGSAMNFWVWIAQRVYRGADNAARERYVANGMTMRYDETGVAKQLTDVELKAQVKTRLVQSGVDEAKAEEMAQAIVSGIVPEKKPESKLRKAGQKAA